MTSDRPADSSSEETLYVWMHLPDQPDPVVAGRLDRTRRVIDNQPVIAFTYSRQYRELDNAISLFDAELPLMPGTFDPTDPSQADGHWAGHPAPSARSAKPLAGAIRDAAPDAWGRRVLSARLTNNPDIDLGELAYLANADSNRIGALDFQYSASEYVARGTPATLEQLAHAAALIESGTPLPPDLVAAAGHGTSIGGARPKALLTDDDGTELVAKFSSTSDHRPVVRAEALGMLFATRLGLDAPRVRVQGIDTGADVLLADRFDRTPQGGRRMMVSALTILGYRESEARYASYVELARSIRHPGWSRPRETLRELFTRLVLNIAISNNDDHLRNHAAFWDGRELTLTPAYDLAPQPRNSHVSTQAIGITADGQSASQYRLAVAAAGEFLISPAEAKEIVGHVKDTIETQWDDACDEARLTRSERSQLLRREFLNPYADYDEA
jgi:serine/threonine-protein kinase HipA